MKYDAFEYDFYDNPFIPLFSFLHDSLKLSADVDSLLRATSKQTGKVLLNSAFTIVNTIFKFKTGKDLTEIKDQFDKIKKEFDEENSLYEDFKKFNTIKKSIKDELESKASNKNIILIIDELDRCSPSFAIGTLEIVKYFLDIKNIVVILSLDEKQLQESVKTIYGQGIDSDVYFSKFFDYKFNLSGLKFSQIIDESTSTRLSEIIPSMENLFELLHVSSRDSKKIFTEFSRKFSIYNEKERNWSNHQCLFILFMITIKNIDLLFYNNIIHKNFDSYHKMIQQIDYLDKKKYFKVFSRTLFGESSILNCLNSLMTHADDKYIDIKYLYYTPQFASNEEKVQINVLKAMNLFIPQVSVEKTYMENLVEILRK